MIPRARIDAFINRHKRLLAIVFWMMAVLATALAWAGMSFRDMVAALPF